MTKLRVAVGIATSGRKEILSGLVVRLQQQTLPPYQIVIAPRSEDDVDAVLVSNYASIIYGAQGSCAQRNKILDCFRETEANIVIFFDDDFIPADDYLERMADAFLRRSLVIADGKVLADGAKNCGLTVNEAENIISLYKDTPTALLPKKSVYGCNMALRLDVVNQYNYRFDENLPAYGWLEDILLSLQMSERGECMQVPSACGVHLGTKAGRTSGIRFGYSQVANPLYIWRKVDNLGLKHMVRLIFPPVLRNMIGIFRPEPYIDRRGRFKGNLLAILDLIRGKAHPTRITSM